MPFLTELKSEHIPGTLNWRLLDDLVYEYPNGEQVMAPKGMTTDMFSIPGPLRGLLFRTRNYPEAAVLHDAVCQGKTPLTRFRGDRLIRIAMLELGATRALGRAVYIGVRIGSGIAGGQYRPH